MASRSVLTMIVGPPGSAKTYSCIWHLVHDFLPHNKGPVVSNLPLNIDAICDWCEKKYKGRIPWCTGDALRDRIRPIPDEVFQTWYDDGHGSESGPWEYFQPGELQGALVILDEVHEVIQSRSEPKTVQKWKLWLGGIRHSKAEVWGLSQDEMKIGTPFRQQCGLKIELINGEIRRDPVFQIPMADWYELRAGLITGKWAAGVFELEFVKINGKWKSSQSRRFELRQEIFDLYNSYNALHGGNEDDDSAASPADVHRFQQMTKPSLLRWFISRHWWRFGLALGVVGVLVWLCTGGGSAMLTGFSEFVTSQAVGSTEASNDPLEKSTTEGGETPGNETEIEMGDLEVSDEAALVLEQIQEIRDELAERRRQSKLLGRIVCLSGDRIVFSSGLVYFVGEALEHGDHKGKIIRSINHRRRCVILNDGTKLWLDIPF